MAVVSDIPRLPPRRADGHKGNYGRVLVVGGSRGMIGAPALAANAALRAGAGLVRVAAPQPVQLAVAALCPCCTSVPIPADPAGECFGPDAAAELLALASDHTALAIGPGMGVTDAVGALVVTLLEESKRPAVVDAYALNNLANRHRWPDAQAKGLVLTPHPGEFARLTGLSTAQVQADRVNLARRFAAEHGGLVLVLKGRGSVVTDGEDWYVNGTGNPGMATGGTGDVLTGVIAGLIAQGLAPFDAACLGVYVHGLAGDLAARKLGQVGLIATDLLNFLPPAFASIC